MISMTTMHVHYSRVDFDGDTPRDLADDEEIIIFLDNGMLLPGGVIYCAILTYLHSDVNRETLGR